MLYACKPAVYILVEFEDLAVGVDVAVTKLNFGFKLRNSCRLLLLVTRYGYAVAGNGISCAKQTEAVKVAA